MLSDVSNASSSTTERETPSPACTLHCCFLLVTERETPLPARRHLDGNSLASRSRCPCTEREKDRERAQARNGSKNSKNKDDGLTPEQRRERDGKALQEKAAKKAAQAEAAGGSKENKGTAKNSTKK
ncbi:unnamed protein product [Cuscuta campestris]|uniref:Small EDRK-rich factor-like N-terminal domain-containing protein n=1 Tax=Cuscuta campestris TaxID=132261 RepID=A0A484KPU5_9ASTE|nr:unnamed protein product [Cuscuta campestris]